MHLGDFSLINSGNISKNVTTVAKEYAILKDLWLIFKKRMRMFSKLAWSGPKIRAKRNYVRNSSWKVSQLVCECSESIQVHLILEFTFKVVIWDIFEDCLRTFILGNTTLYNSTLWWLAYNSWTIFSDIFTGLRCGSLRNQLINIFVVEIQILCIYKDNYFICDSLRSFFRVYEITRRLWT